MLFSNSCRLTAADMLKHDLSTHCHALFVENIRSFFDTEPADWTNLDWDAKNIARVMSEFKVSGDLQHIPVLVVGAPDLSYADIGSEQFMFAWNLWLSQERQNGSDVNYVVTAHSNLDSDAMLVRPHIPGERLVEIRIYTKEYFQAYTSPWRDILDELNVNLAFPEWRNDPRLSLRDRFDFGDAYSDQEANPSLSLASVLTGPNRKIEVGRPYYIPAPPGTVWSD